MRQSPKPLSGMQFEMTAMLSRTVEPAFVTDSLEQCLEFVRASRMPCMMAVVCADSPKVQVAMFDNRGNLEWARPPVLPFFKLQVSVDASGASIVVSDSAEQEVFACSPQTAEDFAACGMRNAGDVAGLTQFLRRAGVMPPSAVLLRQKAFLARRATARAVEHASASFQACGLTQAMAQAAPSPRTSPDAGTESRRQSFRQ